MMIHWAWIILLTSFFTICVNHSIRIGAYPVLLPQMIQALSLNMTQAGIIRAGFFITYVLFSPLMGWLTDRIGGRFVISFFCLFLGAGTFLLGQASNLFNAILFHGIVGIGSAAMWTPTVALIQKWFGAKRRGLALGILSTSSPLGFGLMGLILPTIVISYSWRMGWYLLGLSGLILVVVNAFLLRSDPEEMGLLPWGEVSKSIPFSSKDRSSIHYRDFLRQGPFWLIGLSYSSISFGAYIVTDFIVTYGVIELKLPYPAASAFISIMAFTGIAGGFVLMSLSDYIGRKKSLLVIHSLVTFSILLIICVAGNISLVRIGIGVFGFLYGAIFPMYAVCARDYFPKEVGGTVIGLFTLFYGVGAILGPIIAGLLADVTGTFRWSFGLAALTSWMAALLIGFLGKPKEFERIEG